MNGHRLRQTLDKPIDRKIPYQIIQGAIEWITSNKPEYVLYLHERSNSLHIARNGSLDVLIMFMNPATTPPTEEGISLLGMSVYSTKLQPKLTIVGGDLSQVRYFGMNINPFKLFTVYGKSAEKYTSDPKANALIQEILKRDFLLAHLIAHMVTQQQDTRLILQ